MATSNFQLQASLTAFIDGYKKEKSFSVDDLEELKSHLLDSYEELQSKGLGAEEAFWLATKRLGTREELSTEFNKLDRGPQLSAETFWIIYGLFVFSVLYQLWGFTRSFNYYFSFQAKSDIEFLLLRLATTLTVCIAGYFLIVNRRVFNWIERRFSAMPLDVFVLTSFAIIVSWFTWYFGERFLMNFLVAPQTKNSVNGTIIIPGRFASISTVIPVIILLFVIMRLLHPTIKEKKLGSLFNKFGYVGLFVLGIGLNFLAALSRMMGGGFSMTTTAIVFGLIYGTGIFLATRAISQNPFRKILVLASFALVSELLATWFNPALTQGTPLSVYFYATVLGGMVGYWAGKRKE